MLDKCKIITELKKNIPQVFFVVDTELSQAKVCWELLIHNCAGQADLISQAHNWNLAVWSGQINSSYGTQAKNIPYSILGVDGSQIYPDRHQAIACFLLNIGLVHFIYNIDNSQVKLTSIPTLVTALTEGQIAQEITTEIVDLQRTELEFTRALASATNIRQEIGDMPFTVLLDGTLIFWSLENKEQKIKEKYLASYLAVLQEFYNAKQLVASFISSPKSKDIVRILQTAIAKKIISTDGQNINFENLVDADIMRLFLKPFTRSAVFAYTGPLMHYYPAYNRPHFAYIALEEEIVRIELPAWIAQDVHALDTLVQIIIDQCKKGQGYPVALSEAHEQAVVKTPDRDFFFQMLQKISFEHNSNYTYSQKSIKKRIVPV